MLNRNPFLTKNTKNMYAHSLRKFDLLSILSHLYFQGLRYMVTRERRGGLRYQRRHSAYLMTEEV